MESVIRQTSSVCPVCLARLPAAIVRRGDDYFIEKRCPEHGEYSAIVWRGGIPSYEEWGAGYTPPRESAKVPNCPTDCGLCSGHLQKTCCALVEVTRRCDLSCSVCFAESGGNAPEPTVSELYDIFRRLVREGNTFVQLSGGEPTVRDDLPEIVDAARRAGCEHIQLNSNGVRLGRDSDFVKALRAAGLSFVFMQFDGTDDAVYEKLRGRALLADKRAAINNCTDEFLGVTLVPTLVPGINDHQIGDILDFGLSLSPAVRGVHFQPISYFGRYPHPPQNSDRITLPEVLRAIETQSGWNIKISDFNPSACDHPYCGFHGDFVVLPKKMLMKLSKKKPPSGCCDDEHLKNRRFVSRRWKRDSAVSSDSGDYRDLGAFLSRVKSHGFTVTAMAFQDAYNLDIERLRRCSLHVIDGGRTVPFCAKYQTAASPS